MAEIVTMPRLSDTMTEGVVAKWHKNVGDPVKEGDLLAEIETDKATMEFESFQEGVLLYIGVEEGKTAPVDSILAILGAKGEDVSALLREGKNSSVEAAPEEAKNSSMSQTTEQTDTAEHASGTAQDGSRLKASPLARKMALDKGLDLHSLKGSGEGGRIVKRDLESVQAPENKGSHSVTTQPSGIESYEDVPLSSMRKTIARRLAESKFSAPHFYLTVEIAMDQVVRERKRINEAMGAKVSVNDFVIKAAALGLLKHPKVNSSWLGDRIRLNHHVHIGVAVAVDEGLLVPVVRFADRKGLSGISDEVRDLAGRARDRKLQPSDWEGSTFTISNLGMFGIEEFTAIINPPDACILAVGAVREVPVVVDGALTVGQRMKVTLSCDHRVVDGATGAAFLQTLSSLLEQPLSMLY